LYNNCVSSLNGSTVQVPTGDEIVSTLFSIDPSNKDTCFSGVKQLTPSKTLLELPAKLKSYCYKFKYTQ